MATRQKDKDKDIVSFYKKLKKRYPKETVATSRDHKILEHLVFAVFLENATFDQACSCFHKMERYFIDWNEVRVCKANEIASVIGNVPNAFKIGERLRRLLQWIFDKTFKFDLEDLRAKGVEETLGFLKSVPFSTRFMNEYATLFGFGLNVFPMDEGVLRVFRLLDWVEVCDEQETVPCLDGAFNNADFLKFFFAAHKLGCELMDEATQQDAIKFLESVDADVAKRSFEPLVESAFPTDPSEIAKLYAKHERPKNVSTSAMMSKMFGGGSMDSEDFDESDDFDKNGDDDFDSYNEGNVDEFGVPGDLSGRRDVQDSVYGSGKRVETTLSKDGASYFEGASESVGLKDREESRSVRSDFGGKSRMRIEDAESGLASPRRSAKTVSTRNAKGDDGLSFETEDLVAARGTSGKKPKEKKIGEKKSSESEADGVEKSSAKSVGTDEVKKSSVKKSVRSAKSKTDDDGSKSSTKTSAETAEKKKTVSEVQESSEKKSIEETVKKENKTPSKASKEKSEILSSAQNTPPLAAFVSRRRKQESEKEQVSDDGATVKPKRKRESDPPKSEPPAKRSKKG